MGAIQSLSHLINLLTGGGSGAPEEIFFYYDGSTQLAPAVGTVISLWTWPGIPAGGAAPGAVFAPTNTTSGAWQQTDPAGGLTKWIVSSSFLGPLGGTLIIYDRLLTIGGFSGTNTGAQTVGGSLTRYTNGAGNMAWAETYTALGGSATTMTMSYTNGAGSGQTSDKATIGGAGFGNKANQCMFLPLAPGDTGIQGITSVTLAATTGTVGNFGITIGHPLLVLPLLGEAVPPDFNWTTMPIITAIQAGACISALWIVSSTTVPSFAGFAQTVCA